MSLKDELENLRAKARTDENIRMAYEGVVNQLGRAEAAGRALKVGDVMPSFLLPNAEGRLVFSEELLRQGGGPPSSSISFAAIGVPTAFIRCRLWSWHCRASKRQARNSPR